MNRGEIVLFSDGPSKSIKRASCKEVKRMTQKVWFEAVAGKYYEIKLKDGRIYIYKANGNDILADLGGIDISESVVTEISRDRIKKYGWQ